jgi:hypothetical protein
MLSCNVRVDTLVEAEANDLTAPTQMVERLMINLRARHCRGPRGYGEHLSASTAIYWHRLSGPVLVQCGHVSK